MAEWQNNFASGPLNRNERVGTRRMLQWYDRKVFFRESAGRWLQWLALVPPTMFAAYQIIKVLL